MEIFLNYRTDDELKNSLKLYSDLGFEVHDGCVLFSDAEIFYDDDYFNFGFLNLNDRDNSISDAVIANENIKVNHGFDVCPYIEFKDPTGFSVRIDGSLTQTKPLKNPLPLTLKNLFSPKKVDIGISKALVGIWITYDGDIDKIDQLYKRLNIKCTRGIFSANKLTLHFQKNLEKDFYISYFTDLTEKNIERVVEDFDLPILNKESDESGSYFLFEDLAGSLIKLYHS